ncbi:MAG: hypothetical protein K8U03_11850 [Planctomycetia bacterium]|nr:hypothetical protein [Planctomycetia bacterium]
MARDVMRRIVKVGGSLLTSPTLVDDLQRWTAEQVPAQTLFLAGGGALVDAIAEQQRTLGFDDRAAHWLCIRAMQIHYEMLAALMPQCARITSFDARTTSERASSPGLAWIDPWAFMQHDATCSQAVEGCDPLPADWSVSSDSIAARAATLLGAEELVLLKSTTPASTFHSATANDYVDHYFNTAARGIPHVRFVNFREPGFPETRYRATSSFA